MNKKLLQRAISIIVNNKLAENNCCLVSIVGFSMEPTFYENDKVIICKSNNYTIGDIVLFLYKDQLLIHRIIALSGSKIICKGDNAVASEIIEKDHILGKVIETRKSLFEPVNISDEDLFVTNIGSLTIDNQLIDNISRKIVLDTINWKKLQIICLEQRMYAQFLQAVTKTSIQKYFSPEILRRFKAEYSFQRIQYIRYKREIIRIQDYLRENGIDRCLVIKGISYYGDFYPTYADRQIGDIDLVVKRKDLVKTVQLIRALGYHPMDKNKGWTDVMYEEDSLGNIHVAQLMTKQYEVEIHIDGYYYSSLDLSKVMERAEYDTDGILIPTFEDVFLLACLHAWHHFPIRNNPLRTTYSRLGQLMDVIVSYESMRKRYSHEQIMNICKDNGVEDIIRFIICTSYMVFNQERNPFIITKSENNLWNWNYNNERITLVDRYLHGKLTAEVVDNWYKTKKREISIFYNVKNGDLRYKLVPSFEDKQNRWVYNILETSVIDLPTQGLDFDFAWEKETFCFLLKYDSEVLPVEEKGFSTYGSHIVLRLAFDISKEPFYFLFQNKIEIDIYVFLYNTIRYFSYKIWSMLLSCDKAPHDDVYYDEYGGSCFFAARAPLTALFP